MHFIFSSFILLLLLCTHTHTQTKSSTNPPLYQSMKSELSRLMYCRIVYINILSQSVSVYLSRWQTVNLNNNWCYIYMLHNITDSILCVVHTVLVGSLLQSSCDGKDSHSARLGEISQNFYVNS